MPAICDVSTWKDITFTCVNSEIIERPNNVATRFEWATKCRCGSDLSFKAFPWQFPHASVREISKYKTVKTACGDCLSRGAVSGMSMAERLYESVMMLCKSTIEIKYPISTKGIVAYIAGLTDKEYAACFLDEEQELSKGLRVALLNAHKRGGRGVINKVMTKGRQEGHWTYRHNRWYTPNPRKVTVIRRDIETLQLAVHTVQFALMAKGSPTAPEIHEFVVGLYRERAIAENVAAKFAIGGTQRARAAALLRILNHMKDLGLATCDRAGKGARWELTG